MTRLPFSLTDVRMYLDNPYMLRMLSKQCNADIRINLGEHKITLDEYIDLWERKKVMVNGSDLIIVNEITKAPF